MIQQDHCTFEDCQKPRRRAGNGRSRFCSAHHSARYRTGDTSPLEPVSVHGNRDPHEPISYETAHAQVRYCRGRAKEHTCECGRQAQEWAFIGGSGHERQVMYRNRPTWISAAAQDYSPLCWSCHRRLDAARRRLAAVAA